MCVHDMAMTTISTLLRSQTISTHASSTVRTHHSNTRDVNIESIGILEEMHCGR